MMLDEDASVEMVQLLLSYGAKLKLVDKVKNSALHHAAENGVDADTLRALIGYGINVNLTNKEGKTALMIAAENSEDEVVNILLESGANAASLTRDGKTAWDFAESESVRSTLVAYGAQPTQ